MPSTCATPGGPSRRRNAPRRSRRSAASPGTCRSCGWSGARNSDSRSWMRLPPNRWGRRSRPRPPALARAPLLGAPAPNAGGEAVTPPTAGAGPSPDFAGKRAEYVAAGPQNFALELGFEELPPHVLAQAIEQVRAALTEGLAGTRLAHGE